MLLGRVADGRALNYDERLYEFRLDTAVAPYSDIEQFDTAGQIKWRSAEQHDWFARIDPEALAACNEKALSRNFLEEHAGMSPQDQVRSDAARDDSVLAGKIVDVDPALVQAVADKLAEQGFAAGVSPDEVNPLAVSKLPRGMEALSQFERAQDSDRKMTRSEERLMNKILRNDSKEQARREKELASLAKSAEKEEERQKQKEEMEKESAANEDERALLEMRERNRKANECLAAPAQRSKNPFKKLGKRIGDALVQEAPNGPMGDEDSEGGMGGGGRGAGGGMGGGMSRM